MAGHKWWLCVLDPFFGHMDWVFLDRRAFMLVRTLVVVHNYGSTTTLVLNKQNFAAFEALV
jgi:hypothetical protein